MKILKYKGIFFDEYTEDELGTWAEMCDKHVEQYRDILKNELSSASLPAKDSGLWVLR